MSGPLQATPSSVPVTCCVTVSTIDLEVPPSEDVATFIERVAREVCLLGHEPTVQIVSRGIIRASTPGTLAQRGRGAHRA